MSFIVTASHGACQHAGDTGVSEESGSTCSQDRGHAEFVINKRSDHFIR